MKAYTIEIKPLGTSSRGGKLHSIHIRFKDDGLTCEYERSSTSQLSRKLAEIHYLIDEIYELTSAHCSNSNRKFRCSKDNNQNQKWLCNESEGQIEELPRRNWTTITKSFKEKVKKIFEDNPRVKS